MYGIKYISAIEAEKRRHLSKRRAVALCGDGRITGAQKAGAYRIISENAKKPSDAVLNPVNISESMWRKRSQTETEKLSYTDP